eukprot:augustus_masked-scaffold_88-processed-gene-0.57-mRNA-1 protein AED:1.00 eAED:1.00 QI:0/-1/0/0/-1/1/1/0/141
MVAKKGGSDRVTRSAKKSTTIRDEDLMEILRTSNPKDRPLSVDTAEGEYEFEPSVEKPTQKATAGTGETQDGGELIKKTGKKRKVGAKTKSAKKKRKATSKTAKSVAKRSKPVKATANEGVVDEVEILGTSDEFSLFDYFW